MVVIRLNSTTRTIFKRHYENIESETYLLDTGAELTLYTKAFKKFMLNYPDAYDSGLQTIIGGFGGKGVEYVPIYIIPKFELAGITFYDFPVALQISEHLSVDLIITASVLRHNEFSVNLFKRELKIDNTKAEVYCKMLFSEVDNSICNSVAVFTQEG